MPNITFNAPNAIAQPLKQYLGNHYTNAVSSHIPEMSTSLNPSFPIQTYDFAYSTQNDFGGTLPHIQQRSVGLPILSNFSLTPHEFNIQITSYHYDVFESMIQQQMYATSSNAGTRLDPTAVKKASNVEMFNFVIQNLAMRSVTVNEKLLFDVVTNASNFTPSNTQSITPAIPSWTKKEGGELMQALAEGAEYLNKMTGNQLLTSNANEAPELTPEYELIIVLPRKIYHQFVGIWNTAMDGFQTLMGYDGKGNVGGTYRGLTPALFANATGFYGAKVVCAQTYTNNSITNELDPSNTNFSSLWDQEDAIYMFTTSTNILQPASIIKPTYKPESMFNTLILDTQYIKTSGIYDYFSPIDKNIYKINLTVA